MAWLDRFRGARATHARDEEPDDAANERSSPGLATLFETLRTDAPRALLDLGPASDGPLQLYSCFARQIRFAGLVPRPPRGPAWGPALRGIPPNPDQPYDVVLAWDVLDRIDGSERDALVRRLTELCAPGAWLYTVVDTSEARTRRPVRMTAVDGGRVRQDFVGGEEPARPPLLPAHVERELAPFRVVRAYTLRSGHREYVASLDEGGVNRAPATP